MIPPENQDDTRDNKLAPQPPHAPAISELFSHLVTIFEKTQPISLALLVLCEDVDTALLIDRGSESIKTSRSPRNRLSQSLFESAVQPPRILDLDESALDRQFEIDRRLHEVGAKTAIVTALFEEGQYCGALILASQKQAAFERSISPAVAALAEVLTVAATRERLWAKELTRHQRRVRLEAMLPMIAESLDVRKVFVTLSGLIKEVIPHDVLAFALLLPDRSGVRIQAATHMGVLELPEYRFSNPEEALDSNWRFLLAYDLQPIDENSVKARISPRLAKEPVEVVVRPGPAWMKFITKAGIHSTMRVPIRSKDRPIGGVAFMSRASDAYDEEDGIVASRIADQLALALAHQELAEDAQRMAVAEERSKILERQVESLSRELERVSTHRAVGNSSAWKKSLALATQVAETDTTVLLTGESGTGKEVVARYIHKGSKRSSGPFVAVNCAALPEQLLESELFGRERGAYTGAVDSRPGKIEQAVGGVLFLDEVGEMSPPVQAKFLRVLQEREFQRVGGTKTLKADVRIVAATNRDPKTAIASGTLREDLYYRLGVFEIRLPALRERPDDILVLAEAFLDEVGAGIGRPAAGISDDARQLLTAHEWPGNVRELRNAIERAVIVCQGGLITHEHLPINLTRTAEERVAIAAPVASDFPAEGVALDSVERELVVKAMAKANNNKSKAAALLGVSRGQLYSLLRKHGLTDARR